MITILEASVPEDRAAILQETYEKAVQKPDKGIVETFLTRGSRDPSIWQIITIWESRAVLEEMRQSGETPRGVLIFRAACAEPILSVFSIVGRG